MSKLQSKSQKLGRTGISVLAVLSVMAAGIVAAPPILSLLMAHAESHTGDSSGHAGAGKGKGGDNDSESHDTEGHEGGSGKKGKSDQAGQAGNPNAGGPDGSGGEGKGKGNAGNAGTRPVWAKEGIPEVELGRLNVARSPDQVLSRAYAEAMATYTAQMAEFYKLPLDGMVSELSLNWDNIAIIDSPLQNLAMLKEALTGTQVLGGVNNAPTLMAAFLGTASDKTVPISTNTVIAITTILGSPMSGAAASKLAQDAEKIRIAILAGHG